MSDQRRHQRVRFNQPPRIRVGQRGRIGVGELLNLSLGGLMIRTAVALTVGEVVGCEFSVFGSPVVDMPAAVVSKVGDLYGARFEAGPISELLIQDAIKEAIAAGNASILSINNLNGYKVMRIAGGLNQGLRNDFMNGLTRVGVDEIDLSGVTRIDSSGLALCAIALETFEVKTWQRSPCVESVWREISPMVS